MPLSGSENNSSRVKGNPPEFSHITIVLEVQAKVGQNGARLHVRELTRLTNKERVPLSKNDSSHIKGNPHEFSHKMTMLEVQVMVGQNSTLLLVREPTQQMNKEITPLGASENDLSGIKAVLEVQVMVGQKKTTRLSSYEW
ncbi:hypothetical protein TIFTF001_028251 [Ficus carica]|uniref:Uncharacterized protein n=1 Tax=Ficus carica TaxID=3494 RepID=A0AA88J0Z2_FICCA|nr:hypothetical protein TIFTF001_028251 [Ficus carica]